MAADYIVDDDRPDLGGNVRHGDAYTWSPNFWRYLVERFGISSVLDVGCGEGHAVKFFHRMGLVAHGIDGLLANVQRAVTPIALHDLLTGPYIMPVDMVWSCEIAEHIAESCADNYLDTLANGRVVAMTHAVPGQVGHHHVNCQPAEYWIERMAIRGFRLARDNELMKDIARKELCWNHFERRGLMFTRE